MDVSAAWFAALRIGLALPGLILLISPWEEVLALGAVGLALASGSGWALICNGLLAGALGWLLWVCFLRRLRQRGRH